MQMKWKEKKTQELWIHFCGFTPFQVICPTCRPEFVCRREGIQAVLDHIKPMFGVIQYAVWQEPRRHQKRVQEISHTRELYSFPTAGWGLKPGSIRIYLLSLSHVERKWFFTAKCILQTIGRLRSFHHVDTKIERVLWGVFHSRWVPTSHDYCPLGHTINLLTHEDKCRISPAVSHHLFLRNKESI